MKYYDSNITVGYYRAFGVQFADHTYAIFDYRGEKWAFPCFGMVAEKEGERGNTGVHYPVDMWTPYMRWHQNVGPNLKGNLFVALGMAQYNRTNPTRNFRLSEWNAYWDSGWSDGLACYSGIVYGVSGVCHQTCNRILWSSRQFDFTECPVNWPPSFSASYWVYGYYGKTTEHLAISLIKDLIKIAPAMSSHYLSALSDTSGTDRDAAGDAAGAESDCQNLIDENASVIGAHLKSGVDASGRRAEIEEMLTHAPEGLEVANQRLPMDGVYEADARFQKVKRELDTQLLRGEVAHQEYAHQINAAFHTMVGELHEALPSNTFETLFPEALLTQPYQLVDPKLMPDNYARIQEAAKL